MNKTISIPIGGLHKQSLIDYPGNVSAVVFTCGCNFRCTYCHNMQLVYPDPIEKQEKYDVEELLGWFNKNRQLLDAVVLTGGEPTLHKTLPLFLTEIKVLGLKVKLDTNGTNPDMLHDLLQAELVDFVAMDIKAPLTLARYRKIVGDKMDDALFDKLMRSIHLLKKGTIAYEFRTTVDESFELDDFLAIADNISGKYYLQNRRGPDAVTIQKIKDADIEIIRKKLPKDTSVYLR